MITLLAVLAPIALLNSLLVLPGGMTGIAASLGSNKPVLNASGFITGMFVPHFAFGLLLVIGLENAIDQLNLWMDDVWRDPDTAIILLQFVIGVVMVVFGYRLSSSSQVQAASPSSKPMAPVRTFSIAAGWTLIKLPMALPYFAAIEQILRADLQVHGAAAALLFYNLVYLAPFMAIVLASQLFGSRTDRLFAALSRFLVRWGKSLLFYGLFVLGLVLVIDAVGWFIGLPQIATFLR